MFSGMFFPAVFESLLRPMTLNALSATDNGWMALVPFFIPLFFVLLHHSLEENRNNIKEVQIWKCPVFISRIYNLRCIS